MSAINDYERGGLKMIDVDCMIRSLRLGWLQRVFNDSSANNNNNNNNNNNTLFNHVSPRS